MRFEYFIRIELDNTLIDFQLHKNCFDKNNFFIKTTGELEYFISRRDYLPNINIKKAVFDVDITEDFAEYFIKLHKFYLSNRSCFDEYLITSMFFYIFYDKIIKLKKS